MRMRSSRISSQLKRIYDRPVFAFEFAWTTEDRVGVIQVDGLTGEVIENGQWFKEKMETILTREMLFKQAQRLPASSCPEAALR